MYELCLVSNLTSSEWASWVQAIGAILAIIFAGYFIRWQVGEQGRQQRELSIEQQTEQRRLSKEDEIRRLRIVASAFFHCRCLLETMKRRVARELPTDAELELLVHHAQAMYAIPAMDVPDPRATYAIASARSAVETLRRELEIIAGNEGALAHQQESRLNVALTYLESHESTVADCLEKRGSCPLRQSYTLDDGGGDHLVVHSHNHPALFGLEEADFRPATQ